MKLVAQGGGGATMGTPPITGDVHGTTGCGAQCSGLLDKMGIGQRLVPLSNAMWEGEGIDPAEPNYVLSIKKHQILVILQPHLHYLSCNQDNDFEGLFQPK